MILFVCKDYTHKFQLILKWVGVLQDKDRIFMKNNYQKEKSFKDQDSRMGGLISEGAVGLDLTLG